jgi:hypothetical protein
MEPDQREEALAESMERRATMSLQRIDADLSDEAKGPGLHAAIAAEATFNSHTSSRMTRMSAFYRHWVAAVRLEFPSRANRPSDRAAMSRWLAGQMRAKGIRVTHAADAIPRVVAIAINPSRAEVIGDQMGEVARIKTVGEALWSKVMRRLSRLIGLKPAPPQPPSWGG